MRDAISLLTLAFFAPIAGGTAGCVSNEYVIPHDELVRLATLSAESRGARVHAIQSIGERETEAIEPPAQFVTPPPPPEEAASDTRGIADTDEAPGADTEGIAGAEATAPIEDDRTDSEIYVEGESLPDIHIRLGGTAGGPRGGYPARIGPRPHPPRSRPPEGVGRAPAPVPVRSHSPIGGAAVSGGSPSGGAGHTMIGRAPRPVGNSGGTGSHVGLGRSGGGSSGSGSGGGSGGGEMLLVLAVVAVAVAAVAMVGLIASEGARFDGHVEMSPDQPIHLKYQSGTSAVVPLAAITDRQAASTATARVMDNEGYGLRMLDHVLDRRGFTFKLDFGTVAFQRDTSTQTFSGLTSHIQLGYFITPHVGLLATAGLGGADDGLSATLTRHELGLELQAFPFAFGPVHLGAYVNGGMAVLGTTAVDGTAVTGKAIGGGALLELGITGRMALTLRAGGDIARFDAGWSPAASIAAGVAVY